MAKQQGRGRQQTSQARAQQQRAKQRNARLTRVVVGLVLIAGLGYVFYRIRGDREFAKSLITATYSAGQHINGPITYRETPPLGGPHNALWQNCGIYDVPIHNEHGVHALEHGAVWITYRPDLPADQLQQLKTLAADDFMLLSPYPGLPAPVVVSAWNFQLQLQTFDMNRLRQFIKSYKNNPSTTPEFGAPCTGGTSGNATSDTLTSGVAPMGR